MFRDGFFAVMSALVAAIYVLLYTTAGETLFAVGAALMVGVAAFLATAAIRGGR